MAGTQICDSSYDIHDSSSSVEYGEQLREPEHYALSNQCILCSFSIGIVQVMPAHASLRKALAHWSSLIASCVHSRRPRESLQAYFSMLDDGVQPDLRIFLLLFKACGSIRNLEHGRTLHLHARDLGLVSDPFVASSLLSMFGKCGSLRFSEEVFHEFPQHQRDVVLWNSMLSAYSEQGHEEKAIQLYCELRRTCLNPDHTTYAITLSACAGLAKTEGADTYKSKLTCLEIGQRIHADARRDGLDSHAMVASSLGCLYGKCGVVRQAENSFISLGRHCNIVAWTTLITAYTEHGFEIKALQLYLQLYKEGMVPDQHVFSVVLQACVSLAEKEEEEFTLEAERVKFLPLVLGQSLHIDAAKKGFMSNMFIASMLVTLYSKCGTLVRAENVFRKICKPDLVLWTSMISACVEQGQVIKALEIFKQMQMLGVRLDSTAFASVLQACSEALRLDVCREVHFNTIASGYDSSRFLDNCLIHAYGACACSVDALAVFDSLVQPDIVSWNAPTAGYAREGNCEGCCQILENMLVTSNYPNKVTFSSILYACSHSGKVAQSMHFFETMNKDYGIAAELKHYAIIMDLFGRIGDFVKAKDISNKLPLDLNASLRSSLLGACLKHGNLELGEQLFDGSSEHEPQEYVFMSNLYVDTDFKDYGHQLI